MNLMEALISAKLGGGGSGGGAVTPGTLVIVSGEMTDEQAAQFRENIGAITAADIGTVFTIKGSVATVADLPATGNAVGDVYYVEAVSAGYIWITSTEHPTGYWEELGEPIDLSGLEPKKLVVTVTDSGGLVADKTYSEISDALTAGKTVVCEMGGNNYAYAGIDGNLWLHFSRSLVNSSGVLTAEVLAIKANDAILEYIGTYTKDPAIITDLSSTSITLASAADNTIYEYGDLVSLTVTAIANPGDFIIRFTSGATPTTTNFPASMKFPEAFSAEANMRYEINVSNGYALVAGWPTT